MLFRKSYKVYINYLLWHFRLRQVLPRDIINKVSVVENNEPLIDISKETQLFFDAKLTSPIFLRKKAYEMLINASRSLPNGFFLKVHDAYRTISKQQFSWLQRLQETKVNNPGISETEAVRITRLKIANPFDNGYGGHQTGGAVDVTLCDVQGVDYNLGTLIPEHNEKTKTHSKLLTLDELKYRRILHTSMKNAGFVNYPVEWWHFSYGDKMWAAYLSKDTCIYGLIKN
jgi:D-alanyl-D-alanine dipeptidase